MKQLNEKQTAFLKALEGQTEGLTLAEASKLAQTEFKSGSVNPLVGHYVEVAGTKEVLVTTKRKVNVYRLKAQTEAEQANAEGSQN